MWLLNVCKLAMKFLFRSGAFGLTSSVIVSDFGVNFLSLNDIDLLFIFVHKVFL